MMNKNKSGFALIEIIVVVVLVLIAISGIVGYKYYQNKESARKKDGALSSATKEIEVNNVSSINSQNCELIRSFVFVNKKNNKEEIANKYYCENKSDYFIESLVNGEKRFDELNSVNIAYSEQNKSLGYIIKENEEFCPLINGEKKQCYDFAWMEYPSSFSSDGKRFGYIAHKNQKVFMIIDDVGGPPYDRIGAPLDYDVDRIYFSQDSSKVAYFAFKNEKYFVVIDNKIEKGPYDNIDFIKGLIFINKIYFIII